MTYATTQAPSDLIDALQLLLLIELAQSDLYTRAFAAAGMIPAASSGVFTAIRDHENAHVTLLQQLLTRAGATPMPPPTFDFSAQGSITDGTGASFAFLPSQYGLFTMVAQAFEDLAVRAYTGQVVRLLGDAEVMTDVFTIRAVEGRHASEVRRLRGRKGWITGSGRDDLPVVLQPVYDGEDLTVQGTVDLSGTSTSVGGAAAATEAFDEPLTKDQVTAIVRPFLA